jgi:hypothetical protein
MEGADDEKDILPLIFCINRVLCLILVLIVLLVGLVSLVEC